MKTYKFKTSINCGGCVATITPHLNANNNIKNWTVDTVNPDKILIVEAENLEQQDIKDILEKLGYKAESLLK